tara:strand:- start:27651 stop:30533 length:2883 start_codon:yes stop_codon:yes gene_type:complete
MKKLFCFLLFILTISGTVNAQWILDESFNPQLFPNQEAFNSLGIHGLAVDPDGKVWIQPFAATDSVLGIRTNEVMPTRVIYVFEPNGVQSSFSPLKIITYEDGITPPDTLGRFWNEESDSYETRSGRGLTTDHEGNIIISQWYSLFKVDYKTGLGLARNLEPIQDNPAITEASSDAEGNIYISSVISIDAPMVRLDSNLENPEELFTLTGSFSRDFEVTPDGSTIFWTGWTNRAVYRYSRNDEFSPFEQVPDTILKGFSSESMTIHPVTGDLWLSSGSLNDPPNLFLEKETNWTNKTWYAFNVDSDLSENPIPTDSVSWAESDNMLSLGRPRGIDFTSDGKTVYLGSFNEEFPAVQKHVFTGSLNETSAEVIFSVDMGPFEKFEEFDPVIDRVSVIGEFNDWDHERNYLSHNRDSVYSATIPFYDVGIEDSIFYRFVLNKSNGSTFIEELDSTENRVTFLNDIVSDSDGNGLKEKVLETPFFNDFTYEDAATKVIAVKDVLLVSSAFSDTLDILKNDFRFGNKVAIHLEQPAGLGNEVVVQDTLVAFLPTSGITGNYQKEYFLVSESGDTLSSSIIDITILDAGPVTMNPDSVSLSSGTSIVIEPLENDSFISSELPAVVSGVTNGNFGTADISLSRTKIIYRPISEYVGRDQLVYRVTSKEGTIFEQSIYLNIEAQVDTNSAPFILMPLEITTFEDSDFSFGLHKVLADDRDDVDDLSLFVHPTSKIMTSIDAELGTMSISAPQDWWGQETMIITATDTDGASRTDSSVITFSPVNDFPSAEFLVTGNNNTISFNDNSNDNKDKIDGGVVRWNWDFGDGSSSTNQNPEHTYSEVGSFEVTLTITDNGGLSSESSQTIFIGTVVSNENEQSVPSKFELNQNYPNPFNPSTTIRFGLPVSSNVRISVFNSIGQMVTQLFDGQKAAGFHDLIFDARNLSSGIYIYRIEAGAFVETKKMMLIK